MGNYILWDNVAGRYPKAGQYVDAEEMQDSYIEGVEAWMDAMLIKQFTVPVTGSPPLLKDIAIDLVYSKIAVNKDKGVPTIKKDAMDKLKMIVTGDALLIDSSGDQVATNGNAVWSSEEDYHSTHSDLGPLEDLIDPDRLEDLVSERS